MIKNPKSDQSILSINHLIKLVWKILLAIAYNTNTLIVNPRIYLEFLIPFLIIKEELSLLIILAYIVSLYIYNIVYMINDYIDYGSDIILRRQKRSFTHVFEKNFAIPMISAIIVIFFGVLLFGYHLIPIIIIMAFLAYLHSKYYSLKPITILILRFFRISLPSLILLRIQPSFKDLLLYSLSVFPIYNIKSYIGYLRLKGLNQTKFGIILSIMTSAISIYLSIRYSNIIDLCLYITTFLSLWFFAQIATKKMPQNVVKPFKMILKNIGYEDVEKKSKELIEFLIYLSLLGVVTWF